MATNHRHPGGGTGWYHDDHRTQREFERLKRGTVNLSDEISSIRAAMQSGSEDTATEPDVVTPPERTEATGIVYVNRVTMTPAGAYPDEHTYKYFPSDDTGAYGRYVYGIIEHNLGIPEQLLNTSTYQDGNNPYDDSGTLNMPYLIELVDLHEEDVHDLDAVETAHTLLRFPVNQVFRPEVEPINSNRLIVRGRWKPDLSAFYGVLPVQDFSTDFSITDEDGDTIDCIRTNIIFRWTIKKLENI